MTRKKKIILTALIVVSMLVVLAAGFGTYMLLKKNDSPNSDATKTTSKSELSEGRKAELDGDAKAALEHYKKAKTLCTESDSQCTRDTDVKISIMETTLKEQKNTEVKIKQESYKLSQDAL